MNGTVGEKVHNIPEGRRTALLSACAHVFSGCGYEQASADDIARLCGVSKALVFHYAQSKKGLYELVEGELSRAWLDAACFAFEHGDADFFEIISLLFDEFRKRTEGIDDALAFCRRFLPDMVEKTRRDTVSGCSGYMFRHGADPETAADLAFAAAFYCSAASFASACAELRDAFYREGYA